LLGEPPMIQTPRTTVAGTVRRVVEVGVRQGIEQEALHRHAGFPLGCLDEPEGRVAIERLFGLWTYLAKQLHDAALPIRVAEQPRLEDLHVLGFALMTAPTTRDALRTLVRHGSLLTTSGTWDVRASGRSVEIRWLRSSPSTLAHRLTNETAVAQLVGGLRQLAGPGFNPLQVSFRHAAPANVAAHHVFFRCPVSFDAEEDCVTTARDMLDSISPWANASLWGYVCRDAEARALRLAPRSISEVVLDEVLRGLAHSNESAPALDTVASALGTTERTLRRRLHAEGTTFRALTDRARRERVGELLRGHAVSVTQVAFEAGFSDASALTHACRRWFDCGPRELRARLQNGV